MLQLFFHSPIGDLATSWKKMDFWLRSIGVGERPNREMCPVTSDSAAERLFRQKAASLRAPMRVVGRAYRLRIWAGACCIPFGVTWTQAKLAAKIGSGARAVAAAVAASPLPILMPCH